MARATQLPQALEELALTRGGPVPVGEQLAGRLEALIAGGALAPGEQLPSVRQLADAAGVNVNTVRSVYARLEQRGLIGAEHGRGTFVRGARPPAEREYRRELLRQIGELERQAAYYTRHRIVGAPEPPRRLPAGQVLPATELMAVRDDLLERVEHLRRAEEERLGAIAADRAAAEEANRDERAAEVQTAARRSRGTAASPPRIVSGPGSWVLKWRG